jgi:hypothetical protein
MRSAPRRVLPFLGFFPLLCLSALLGAGCAGAPPASLSSLPAVLSRDGALRYRIPSGWFDASADSVAIPVFLVRGDYAGSIAVKELHVDAAARRDLARSGMLQIARLAAALETGSGRGVIAHTPESIRVNGKEGAAYDLEFGAGEKVRTVLVDTGVRVYSVAAHVNGTAAETAGEIFAAQQAFLEALAW